MSMGVLLNNLGALVTVLLGLLGLLLPARAAQFTGLEAQGAMGTSEIRATYGGFFLALGSYALYCQTPAIFLAAAIAWLGAAGGRVFSMLVDRNLSARNSCAVVFEAAIGIVLLFPQ